MNIFWSFRIISFNLQLIITYKIALRNEDYSDQKSQLKFNMLVYGMRLMSFFTKTSFILLISSLSLLF